MLNSVYAAKNANKDKQIKSSSGGMFLAISDYVLNNKGVVIGAAYNYQKQVLEHIIAETIEERNSMIGSKYMLSHLNNIFADSLQYINQGRLVMFVGTPCQTKSYKIFLENKKVDLSNVLLIDLICHGTPNYYLWDDYVKYFEKKHKKKIEYLTFKNKRNGWNKPTAIAICEGKEYSLQEYVNLYNNGCTLRECCYSCDLQQLNKRYSDITVGDFWGIEKSYPNFYDENGVSFISTNSKFGEVILDKIKDSLVLLKCNLNDCKQPNLYGPTNKSDEFEVFKKDYSKHNIKYMINKYTRTYLFGKIRYKLKMIFKRK